jgi:quercetin dioxygenase-like cupin family protein
MKEILIKWARPPTNEAMKTENIKPDTSSKFEELRGAKVAKVAELVDYKDGSIGRREILKKPTGNVAIFAFDEGQGLTEHTVSFDALVHVLEGEVEISIVGQIRRLQGGDMILMPANQPHALKALKRFKMILTKIQP